MAQIPTFEYIDGADLADVNLWVTENGTLLDLSTANTAQLDVYSSDGTFQFTKTNDIVLQAGSGTQASGIPNVIVQWDISGELDSLATGRYKAILTLNRNDGKQRKRQFFIQMLSST